MPKQTVWTVIWAIKTNDSINSENLGLNDPSRHILKISVVEDGKSQK